jgi:CheY-like chemotaxis protein
MTEEKNPNNKLILLADDDQDYVLSYKLQLEAAGYQVRVAHSGAEAQDLLETVKPDLAVVDLMMEEPDTGFTLCYHLKQKYPGVPVIMVTGVAGEAGIGFDVSTEEERTWIKADAMLDKPIRFEQLLGEIQKLA